MATVGLDAQYANGRAFDLEQWLVAETSSHEEVLISPTVERLSEVALGFHVKQSLLDCVCPRLKANEPRIQPHSSQQ